LRNCQQYQKENFSLQKFKTLAFEFFPSLLTEAKSKHSLQSGKKLKEIISGVSSEEFLFFPKVFSEGFFTFKFQ